MIHQLHDEPTPARVHSRRQIWPAVIFMVKAKPRTAQEIHELTGHQRSAIQTTLKRAEEEGLVSKQRPKRTGGGRGGGTSFVWTWQP